MTQPFLELEEGHGLLCIEQLSGDSGARPVAGDLAARIAVWHPGFAAEERNERRVQVVMPNPVSPIGEQKVYDLPCLAVDRRRLLRTRFLPRLDRFTHHAVHRLAK